MRGFRIKGNTGRWLRAGALFAGALIAPAPAWGAQAGPPLRWAQLLVEQRPLVSIQEVAILIVAFVLAIFLYLRARERLI